MMKKDFSIYLGNFVIIGIVSIVIHIFKSMQYPGGVSGMAPFLLIYALVGSTILTFLVLTILNLKTSKRFYISIIIFILIAIFILFFYLGVNPFNYDQSKEIRSLNLWYYIALLIPSLFMLIRKPLIEK